METQKPSTNSEFEYLMISNIPFTFRTADLRRFFSVFVEEGKFAVFNFRNRPDKSSTVGPRSKCCPVKLTRDNACQFNSKYNNKLWIDRLGNELSNQRVCIKTLPSDHPDMAKFINSELREGMTIPQGNVGTPTEVFFDLIRSCKLPASAVKKLGLEFKKKGRIHKKYSRVPYDYGTAVCTSEDVDDEYSDEEPTKTTSFTSTSTNQNNCDQGDASNEDEDDCEEWERHEALHDHRTSHGTMFDEDKERLYEEEIELQWEKGGSGLVFYTDAQVWEKEQEDHDDWDVDMEGYYVKGGGDQDAKDFLEMRRSERFQKGMEEFSVFTKSNTAQFKNVKRKASNFVKDSTKRNLELGKFELHTKGVGRKIMEKFGWKDGQGLGKDEVGLPEALENDGQGPMDRSGFGYYGEKLVFTSRKERNKRKKFSEYCLNPDQPEKIVIGTIYDDPSQLDVEEPLLRRNAPTYIKRYQK